MPSVTVNASTAPAGEAVWIDLIVPAGAEVFVEIRRVPAPVGPGDTILDFTPAKWWKLPAGGGAPVARDEPRRTAGPAEETARPRFAGVPDGCGPMEWRAVKQKPGAWLRPTPGGGLEGFVPNG